MTLCFSCLVNPNEKTIISVRDAYTITDPAKSAKECTDNKGFKHVAIREITKVTAVILTKTFLNMLEMATRYFLRNKIVCISTLR